VRKKKKKFVTYKQVERGSEEQIADAGGRWGQGAVSTDSLSHCGSWHNVSVKKEKKKKRKLTVMLKAIERIERVNM
jgi:hypothetical protein